jgi:hypothetical protein
MTRRNDEESNFVSETHRFLPDKIRIEMTAINQSLKHVISRRNDEKSISGRYSRISLSPGRPGK